MNSDGAPGNPAPPPAGRPAVGAGQSCSRAGHGLPVFAWSVAAILLAFLCLTHLGVLLCFGLGARVPAFLAPAAFLFACIGGDWLARREGLSGRGRLASIVTALALTLLAVALAASFYDFGWDGLWYHQTAVYQMSHGWNPLREPMRSFSPDLETWVRHYSKGPWYVALALLETTGDIEWAKAAPGIALGASFFAVFAVALDFGRRPRTAAVVAALVALNPVVLCELSSYLVDGLMISFLACFVAALFGGFQRRGALVSVVGAAAAILCINAKLTGLVYVGFAMAAGGLYVLARRRDLLRRYVLLQAAAILLGAVVFGFNPYVTNTVHRGNPFYPWAGSAAHPGFNQGGRDPNERYETPRNLIGRNRVYRLAFAIFGRPGAQPVAGGADARLMWPFAFAWSDLDMYRIHGLRIAGLGPLFSGAFLVGLGVLAAALRRPGLPRAVLALTVGAIVASLLIGAQTWWARYAPQLWWLPVAAVVAGLALPRAPAVRSVAAGLAALLLADAALVAFAHFRWEIAATRAERAQFAFLRRQGVVEVDLQYFSEPFSERLRAAGVRFHATQIPARSPSVELMSVAPGYPAPVRARLPDATGFPPPPSP